MVALRIVPSTEQRRRRAERREWEHQTQPHAPSRRPALRFEAIPADACLTGRIEPGFEVAVERMSDDGLEVESRRPLAPGRRLSLDFPSSPFLPPPGTLARVEACERGRTGYRLRLAFEAVVAA